MHQTENSNVNVSFSYLLFVLSCWSYNLSTSNYNCIVLSVQSQQPQAIPEDETSQPSSAPPSYSGESQLNHNVIVNQTDQHIQQQQAHMALRPQIVVLAQVGFLFIFYLDHMNMK